MYRERDGEEEGGGKDEGKGDTSRQWDKTRGSGNIPGTSLPQARLKKNSTERRIRM
jgi:hypothetical protein